MDKKPNLTVPTLHLQVPNEHSDLEMNELTPLTASLSPGISSPIRRFKPESPAILDETQDKELNRQIRRVERKRYKPYFLYTVKVV